MILLNTTAVACRRAAYHSPLLIVFHGLFCAFFFFCRGMTKKTKIYNHCTVLPCSALPAASKRTDSAPEPRLSMLALLECVVKQEDVTEAALRPHAECLMKEMVVPNAVWRAGIVAATVRKVRSVRPSVVFCFVLAIFVLGGIVKFRLPFISPPVLSYLL